MDMSSDGKLGTERTADQERPDGERDAAVCEQYESFPYPLRDPEEERKRLITGFTSDLRLIFQFIFGGKGLSTSRPLRVLVAGGGTGDSAIFLAQQLANLEKLGMPACEVVYLDQSEKAREICEARAKVRGLDNLRYVIASIHDIPKLDLGEFDIINCLGVLHHMDDPLSGLKALTEVMAPGGGLALMVYGTYGRMGIYPMQDAMRLLTPAGTTVEKLPMARKLFKQVPRTHLLRRSLYFSRQDIVDDNEFVDMFLTPRDRSYTVKELLDWVDDADLAVTSMLPPRAYDPVAMLEDDELKERAAALPAHQKWILADHLACEQANHSFFAVAKDRAETAAAKPSAEMAPILMTGTAAQWAQAASDGKQPKIQIGAQAWPVRLKPEWARFFRKIDGKATIGEICKSVAGKDGTKDLASLETSLCELVEELAGVCAAVLHKPD